MESQLKKLLALIEVKGAISKEEFEELAKLLGYEPRSLLKYLWRRDYIESVKIGQKVYYFLKRQL